VGSRAASPETGPAQAKIAAGKSLSSGYLIAGADCAPELFDGSAAIYSVAHTLIESKSFEGVEAVKADT